MADKPTEHATPSVTIGGIYAVDTVRLRCGLIISSRIQSSFLGCTTNSYSAFVFFCFYRVVHPTRERTQVIFDYIDFCHVAPLLLATKRLIDLIADSMPAVGMRTCTRLNVHMTTTV